MTVKELMNKLSEYDESFNVKVIASYDGNCCYTTNEITDITKSATSDIIYIDGKEW